MNYKNILITGGAGFVGSNFAIKLKEYYSGINVFVLDNLKRRGSELNISRLREKSVKFFHGDVRNKEDFEFENNKKIDLIIECSAEPSVLAGINSPEYMVNTNLIGAINCFELARRNKADVIFLSTSRVYPIEVINRLKFNEEKTRFSLKKNQSIPGVSENGISENFPLEGSRSLYGASKFCAELILQEYISSYGIRAVINRCGVITGPWQFGKVDQGVIVLWIASHIFKKNLRYIGFGGEGKQVRDFIHINDLFEAIKVQLNNFDKFNGEIYNIGGGVKNSLSLYEMTKLCGKVTGNKIKINSVKENRPNDIRVYISDCTKFKKISNWECKKNAQQTFIEIYRWIIKNKQTLKNIFD